MGLKIYKNNMKLHTGWLPVAVSSGLKRSQKGLKVLRSLWRRDHPCVSHGLKAQRNLRRRAHPRVSHGLTVPRNPRRRAHPRVSHGLEVERNPRRRAHARVSHSLTQSHTVSPDANAEAIPKHILSVCNLAKNGHVDRTPIDMVLGCQRQTVPLAP